MTVAMDPERVTATPAALTLIGELESRHGPILFTSRAAAATAPRRCVIRGPDFLLCDRDVRLGSIGGVPFYIGASQFEAWRHTQLIIDVVPGRGGMFSLENGTEKRFITRSRAFSASEVCALAGAPRSDP